MINQTQNFLLLSCIFNILFFIAIALFIAKKGGLSYLFNKVLHILPENKSKHFDYPPYYWHKKSQFEKLPLSESDIIMLGDSITDEGEWTELLGLNVKNRGISGDTTERILHRLNTILESKPKQIFLMIGINDLINDGKSVTATLEQYKNILRDLKEKTPKTKVFVQSVLPVNNKVYLYWQDNNNVLKINSGLKNLAKEFNYEYIDIFSLLLDSENQLDAQYTVDGLHLNGQAYLVWKTVIEKYMVAPEP
ncbi:G-D-S-L family lipolytic protein [Hassallia byssoidea VB512170]|uniref:G-D-S-L family lipolytic protein n=1 Tax=Hassallia byssoidea VB512170 TaxID=1304833 RepID=A0A846H9A7_9CYAN|nr:GDSL-type esterase/lipase family protein [Hassalia byssoidea]NEU73548.1 G-D-S-L family lipolytic protein [Hassalia byssoidea VB512170]